MTESFFATFECELIDRRVFRTRAEARIAIFEYVEGWYNPHRRHLPLATSHPWTSRGAINKRLECQATSCPRKRSNSNRPVATTLYTIWNWNFFRRQHIDFPTNTQIIPW